MSAVFCDQEKNCENAPSPSLGELEVATLPNILKALSVKQLKNISAEQGNKVAKSVLSPTQ